MARVFLARQRAISPTVGIVFVSGDTESEPAVPGAVFLQKPFNPAVLKPAVRTAKQPDARLATASV